MKFLGPDKQPFLFILPVFIKMVAEESKRYEGHLKMNPYDS